MEVNTDRQLWVGTQGVFVNTDNLPVTPTTRLALNVMTFIPLDLFRTAEAGRM